MATRPFPLEWMSKALVVVRLTVQDMLDHPITTIPVPAQQVSFAECFQQRLRLIQPRRIHRREQDMDARREIAKVRHRIVTRVTGAIVDNQVNALGPAIRMQQPAHRRVLQN